MRDFTIALLYAFWLSVGTQVGSQVSSAEAQIAAAEAAATAFPSTADASHRKCTIVKPEQIVFPGGHDSPTAFDLRSGDFVARSISFGWDKTYEQAKIPLTPRHLDIRDATVRLDLTRIDPPGELRTAQFPMRNMTGGGPRFYASAPVFPTPGRWMIIATAGTNWGCFVIDRPVKTAGSVQ
jgi:hypothetical protein